MAVHFLGKRTDPYLVYEWHPTTERRLDGCLAHVTTTGEDGPAQIAAEVFRRKPGSRPFAIVCVTQLSLVAQGRSDRLEATVYDRPGAWGVSHRLDMAEQHRLGGGYMEFLDEQLRGHEGYRSARKG